MYVIRSIYMMLISSIYVRRLYRNIKLKILMIGIDYHSTLFTVILENVPKFKDLLEVFDFYVTNLNTESLLLNREIHYGINSMCQSPQKIFYPVCVNSSKFAIILPKSDPNLCLSFLKMC